MQGPQGPSHRGGCPWSCPELRSGGRSSGSNRWRYVSTIFQAIFSGDIHWNLGLNNRPGKHGRYLHWSWRSPIDRNPRGWGYPGFPRFFQLGSEKSLWDDLKYVGARDIISLCIWPLTIYIYTHLACWCFSHIASSFVWGEQIHLRLAGVTMDMGDAGRFLAWAAGKNHLDFEVWQRENRYQPTMVVFAIDHPAREKSQRIISLKKKWGNRDTGELMFYGCCWCVFVRDGDKIVRDDS